MNLYSSSSETCSEEEDEEEGEEVEEEEMVVKPTLQLSGCEGFVWEREEKTSELEGSDDEDTVEKEVLLQHSYHYYQLSLCYRVYRRRNREDRRRLH